MCVFLPRSCSLTLPCRKPPRVRLFSEPDAKRGDWEGQRRRRLEPKGAERKEMKRSATWSCRACVGLSSSRLPFASTATALSACDDYATVVHFGCDLREREREEKEREKRKSKEERKKSLSSPLSLSLFSSLSLSFPPSDLNACLPALHHTTFTFKRSAPRSGLLAAL